MLATSSPDSALFQSTFQPEVWTGTATADAPVEIHYKTLAEWDDMTPEDFAKYRAIVVPDQINDCGPDFKLHMLDQSGKSDGARVALACCDCSAGERL